MCVQEIWLEQEDAQAISEGEEVTLMDWGNAIVQVPPPHTALHNPFLDCIPCMHCLASLLEPYPCLGHRITILSCSLSALLVLQLISLEHCRLSLGAMKFFSLEAR